MMRKIIKISFRGTAIQIILKIVRKTDANVRNRGDAIIVGNAEKTYADTLKTLQWGLTNDNVWKDNRKVQGIGGCSTTGGKERQRRFPTKKGAKYSVI